MIQWKPEKRRVSELKLWDKNPRTISDTAFDKLKSRITKRGFHDIIKINTDGTVLSGNQRKRALEELGIDEVWALVPDHPLSDSEMKIVAGESNRSDGVDDFDILANEYDIEELQEIGYSELELGKIGIKLEEDGFDEKEALANLGEITVQKGDLYQLGDHRLMCGDSTSTDDLDKLMGGVQANLVFTDPPYMVDYKSPAGNSYNSEKFGGTGGKIFNDNLSDKEALEFYTAVLNNLYLHTTDNCPIYWWYATKNSNLNLQAWENTGWYFSQGIIWLKNSMVLARGQDYHRCFEPCLFGWKKGKSHFRNTKIADFKDAWLDMSYDNFQDQLDVWFEKRDNTSEYIHPTQKPIQLADRALRKSSKVGDAVLDLFGGSGSTLMACHQLNRKAYLMELDPKYVQAIIKRWEDFTGEKAVKIS